MDVFRATTRDWDRRYCCLLACWLAQFSFTITASSENSRFFSPAAHRMSLWEILHRHHHNGMT